MWIWRVKRGNLLLLIGAVWSLSGCSSSDSPVAPSSSQPRLAHLTLKVSQGEAQPKPGAVEYSWCYNVAMEQGPLPVRNITIRKAEDTIIGPDGSSYSVSSASYEGQRMGATYGYLGCPTVFRDKNLARPLATTYRTRIDYTIEGESRTFTLNGEGAFVPKP